MPDREERPIGCAGLERYGELSMLRPVAISPVRQHCGTDSRLTDSPLGDAANNRIRETVLLTATTRDFFARRFGFAGKQSGRITKTYSHGRQSGICLDAHGRYL